MWERRKPDNHEPYWSVIVAHGLSCASAARSFVLLLPFANSVCLAKSGGQSKAAQHGNIRAASDYVS